jgi:hypothetical protein
MSYVCTITKYTVKYCVRFELFSAIPHIFMFVTFIPTPKVEVSVTSLFPTLIISYLFHFKSIVRLRDSRGGRGVPPLHLGNEIGYVILLQ